MGDRVVQLAGDRRPFFHQHQLLLVVDLTLDGQHAGQLLHQGVDQLAVLIVQRLLRRMLRHDHAVVAELVAQAPAQRRVVGMLAVAVVQAGAAHRIMAMLRPQRLVAAQLQQRLPAVVFIQPYLKWRAAASGFAVD